MNPKPAPARGSVCDLLNMASTYLFVARMEARDSMKLTAMVKLYDSIPEIARAQRRLRAEMRQDALGAIWRVLTALILLRHGGRIA